MAKNFIILEVLPTDKEDIVSSKEEIIKKYEEFSKDSKDEDGVKEDKLSLDGLSDEFKGIVCIKENDTSKPTIKYKGAERRKLFVSRVSVETASKSKKK